MVKKEGNAMVQRWMRVLVSVTAVVALLGLAACHKKKKEQPKKQAAVEQTQAGQPAAGEEEPETAPPPSPRPAGPVQYPGGEGPVLAPGARVLRQVREPGHWDVEYTVGASPQEMVEFYRQQAGTRGWTEESSQPMGPGAFINWETAHGELQLIVARSPQGNTSVQLNWNQRQ
jgi:hypothetical protein